MPSANLVKYCNYGYLLTKNITGSSEMSKKKEYRQSVKSLKSFCCLLKEVETKVLESTGTYCLGR